MLLVIMSLSRLDLGRIVGDYELIGLDLGLTIRVQSARIRWIQLGSARRVQAHNMFRTLIQKRCSIPETRNIWCFDPLGSARGIFVLVWLSSGLAYMLHVWVLGPLGLGTSAAACSGRLTELLSQSFASCVLWGGHHTSGRPRHLIQWEKHLPVLRVPVPFGLRHVSVPIAI